MIPNFPNHQSPSPKGGHPRVVNGPIATPVDRKALKRNLLKDNSALSELFDSMFYEAIKEVNRIKALKENAGELDNYRIDPIKFCREVLGEHFTDEITSVIESVRDNPVTIAKSSNAIGKSYAAARVALWWFLVFEDSQVYITAAPPIENLKRILWSRVMSVVHNKPEHFKNFRIKSLNIIRTEDKNHKDLESFVTCVAIPMSGTSQEREAKFSGKHSPHLLFIVDEGDAVPEECYRGIESCMSGGMARLLVMFNPRAQMGWVYNMERDNKAKVIEISAINHPNVVTGADIFPGAVTRDVVVRRINQWTRPMQESEKDGADVFNVPDYLIGATTIAPDGTHYEPLPEGKRKITEPAFCYMVEGRYPPEGETQLISKVWIDNARSRWDTYVAMHGETPPEGVDPLLGLDVAEFGVDYNALCTRYGGYVSRIKSWSGMDVDMSTSRVIDEYIKANAKTLFVDATGIGASIAPSASRQGRHSKLRAIGVKFSSKPLGYIKTDLGEFKYMRDQLWWSVREWLKNDPGAMLPPDPMLLEELRIPTYHIPSDGKIHVMDKDTMKEILKRSPDRAESLALTFHPIPESKWLRVGD